MFGRKICRLGDSRFDDGILNLTSAGGILEVVEVLLKDDVVRLNSLMDEIDYWRGQVALMYESSKLVKNTGRYRSRLSSEYTYTKLLIMQRVQLFTSRLAKCIKYQREILR